MSNGALVLNPQLPAVDPSNGTTLSLGSTGNLQLSVGGAAPVVIGGPQPATGANLGNADATINPASDKASLYLLPAGTLTAARVLTLGVSGAPITSSVLQVVRRDLSANTLTVNDDAGTTLLTFAASPTTAQGATFYYTGTHYALLSFYYVA
jgi:hypothetical protein